MKKSTFIKWAALAVFNLLLKYLVARPLTPVVVLFADNQGWLPGRLWWFQTPDNSLDGDNGWRSGTRPILVESNRFKRWINRCFWLWRNSLYGFNESVLSVHYGPRSYLVLDGDSNVSNAPYGKEGKSWTYVCEGTKMIAWQYYYVKRLKWFPNKCFRVLLGYKVFQMKLHQSGTISLALSVGINKFKLGE